MKTTIYTDDGEYFELKDDLAKQYAMELESLLQGDCRDKWITVKDDYYTTTMFMNHMVGFTIFQELKNQFKKRNQ
jgi:hypothetical protein